MCAGHRAWCVCARVLYCCVVVIAHSHPRVRSQYDAISGQRTKDGKQGELTGLLQTMGYTADQVFKF